MQGEEISFDNLPSEFHDNNSEKSDGESLMSQSGKIHVNDYK